MRGGQDFLEHRRSPGLDRQVPFGQLALRGRVTGEGPAAALRLHVGQREDGARCAQRAGQRQQRGRPDVRRARIVRDLVEQPVRETGGILDPGDRQAGQRIARPADSMGTEPSA